MLRKRFVVCLLLLVGANALADQNTKQAKLRELVELQGLTATMEEAHASRGEQAREVGPMIIAQFKKELLNLDAATMAEMQAALESFVEAASAGVTAAESIAVWIEYYGQNVTEADLDQILAYYRSPAGRKDAVAQGKAGERWTAFLTERSNKAMDAATSAYIERLKVIVQRAAARKSGSQGSR